MACFSQDCNNCDDTLVCWFVSNSNSENIDIANSVDGYYSQGFDGCRALISVNGLPSSAMSQYLETSHNFTGSTALDSIQNGGTYEGYGNGDICNSCSSYGEYIQGAHIVEYGLRRMVPEGEDDISPSSPYTATTILENSMSGLNDLVQVYIPSSVTKIKNGAFSGCSNLNTLIVGTNTKSIGNSAFKDCGIENIDWGCCGSKSLILGSSAFRNCDNLKELNIEDCIKSCGSLCFANCGSLSSVTIGNGLTMLSNQIFYQCSSLLFIDIPDNIKTIGNAAFADCSNLINITIPESVTSLGTYVFSGCPRLESAEILGTNIAIKEGAFNNCHRLTSVTIGSGVTSIGEIISEPREYHPPFAYCGLTSLEIPDNVKFIGPLAFYMCQGLTSVTIGSGVSSISSIINTAFDNCSNLHNVTINGQGALLGVFSGKSSIQNVIIGDNVHGRIYNSAFENCTSLSSVTIGSGITNIDKSAFNGCSGLTSITIPDNVTTIGEDAFANCRSLTSIVFPDSVKTIGSGVCRTCTSLTEVTIGSGVTSIGNNAFSGRPTVPLETLTCLAILPPSISTPMFAQGVVPNIYVPAGSVEDYKSAEGWSEYASKIEAIPF